jgi:hypothetical protein
VGYVEEFELDGNVSMDVVKQRVKSWENSYDGTDYVRLVKSERDIALLKSKHDLKVCCYPCIIALISAMIIPFLAFSYVNVMLIAFGYIAFIMIIFVISYGYFFLGTKKVEYHMTFSFETPIRVRIQREGGAIDEFAHEYESLKKMLVGHTKDSGPDLLW